jgi:cytochrome c peroxidase
VAGDPRAAALGTRLFADPRLSATGRVACASCHQPARGFQDGVALATGVGTGTRRTMSVVGAAYAPWLFWDGRADSPWAQALGPLERREEHGGTRALYVRVLAAHYRREYEALFGALPALGGLPRDAGPFGTAAERAAWAALPAARRDGLTRAFANLGKSIAAYERTLAYPGTRFDRYAAALAAGRRPPAGEILSADEAAGLRLFAGKAQCATCHGGPRLTDDGFHNTGVPAVSGLPADDGRIAGVDAALADPFNCLGAYSDVPRPPARGGDADGAGDPDACRELRFAARGESALLRAYRAPSLRGVRGRAPYMHAGQLPTLAAVLAHYNAAPRAPRGVSELHPLGLSARELAQLEAFLGALDPDTGRAAPVRVAGRR